MWWPLWPRFFTGRPYIDEAEDEVELTLRWPRSTSRAERKKGASATGGRGRSKKEVTGADGAGSKSEMQEERYRFPENE